VNERAVTSERLLTISEVAAFLQVPVGTLYQWRHRGVGPAGLRVGRHVRYRMRDVEAWLEAVNRPVCSALPKPKGR
jgi:excisionase family DNA binding protein